MASTYVSGASGKISRGIYHRSYPVLYRLQFPWRVLSLVAAFQAWLFTVPWLVLKSIAPASILKYLDEAETTYLEIATPWINWAQDLAYKAFSTADQLLNWALVNGYYYAVTLYRDAGAFANQTLAILENRVSLLQDFGLDGVWLVLKAGTSYSYIGTVPGSTLTDSSIAAAPKQTFQPASYAPPGAGIGAPKAAYVSAH